MKFRTTIMLLFILIGSNAFALNVPQDITSRQLTEDDETWVLQEFPRSFMEVYKNKVFVITKDGKSIIARPHDKEIKQEWLTDTAKEEFKDYVLSKNPKYKAIGIIQKGKKDLIGAFLYQLLDNDTLYIAQCFIIPESQKQGIGYYVVDSILPKLHPKYTHYEVLTRQQNDAAILLYNKLGFTIGDISLVKKYDYDPLRYMSFYKDLKAKP